MNPENSDLHTKLIEIASAAEPYTEKEMRTYDDNKDDKRLLATMAKYALEHPNPKLKAKDS